MLKTGHDMDRPLRVGLYARVSSEEQKQGQNIRTQIDFGESYCGASNLGLVDSFIDEAVSGTLPLAQRPAGSKLLRAAHDGKLDAVVVYRLDRLARKLKVLLDTWEELDGLGVAIRSITEPLDTSTPVGRFVMQLMGSIAELERETILERTRDGRESIVRRGYWPGGVPPMGYRLERDGVGGNGHGRAYLVENKEEAEVIRRIFELYVTDRMSVAHLASYLNGQGVQTSASRRRGVASRWAASRVNSILRNPIYKGTFNFYRRKNQHGREPVLGEAPTLVEVDTWEEAQRLLVSNLKASPRNMKRFYLLRGIIKCGLCGRTCVGQGRVGRNRSHYVCVGNRPENEPTRCPGVRVRAEVLEEMVWEDIKDFVRNPGRVVELLAERLNREREHMPDLDGLIKGLDGDVRGVQRRRQWLIDRGSRGLISDGEAEKGLMDAQRELEVLEAKRRLRRPRRPRAAGPGRT